MKVMHIISSAGIYGAEAVILNLAHAHRAIGLDHAVVSFQNSSKLNSALHDRATEDGLEAHQIACRGQFDHRALERIRQVARTTGAGIIHAHGYKADLYAYLALRKTPVPLVSTCHTWYDNDVIVSLYGKLDRRILRSFSSVAAVSEDVRQRLLGAGVAAGKIRIVRNGIDLRPFQNAAPTLPAELAPRNMTVGLIGRLAPEKNVPLFIQAAEIVLRQVPQAKFLIVGEGPDREEISALVTKLGLADSVHLLGRRDDMPGVFASLSILVSSSKQEGLPIAILEGMASGLPVVATSVGEVPTVVNSGETGFLTPSGDADALSAAILDLLLDPAKRRQFGEASCQRIAAEFSATQMSTEYLDMYRAAAKNGAA
jgi:glycosyltransferase involved in cell wall biosynthesis